MSPQKQKRKLKEKAERFKAQEGLHEPLLASRCRGLHVREMRTQVLHHKKINAANNLNEHGSRFPPQRL